MDEFCECLQDKWMELFPTIVLMAKTIQVISSPTPSSLNGSLLLVIGYLFESAMYYDLFFVVANMFVMNLFPLASDVWRAASSFPSIAYPRILLPPMLSAYSARLVGHHRCLVWHFTAWAVCRPNSISSTAFWMPPARSSWWVHQGCSVNLSCNLRSESNPTKTKVVDFYVICIFSIRLRGSNMWRWKRKPSSIGFTGTLPTVA